jgi:hypothetical protein
MMPDLIMHARDPKTVVRQVVDGKPVTLSAGIPTHTFCFSYEDGKILATWAKPHTDYEKFCAKVGFHRASLKMTELVEKDLKDKPTINANLKGLRRYMPGRVASSFDHYLSRAKKFYKVEDKDVPVIIRAVKPRWIAPITTEKRTVLLNLV